MALPNPRGISEKRPNPTPTLKKRRRVATLYDAVSGRVGYEGFLPSNPKASKHRDTTSTSTTPLPPEEVLFKRKHAPLRYEEDDIYFRAYRNLSQDPGNGKALPESDLLKVLHVYASELYASASSSRSSSKAKAKGRGEGREGQTDGVRGFYSLDETALLALGILLEEVTAEAIGRSEVKERILEGGG